MALTTEPRSVPARSDPDVPTVPIYRLSVAQYHAMAAAGILGEDEPVELLEGWLVKKMTKRRPHVIAAALLRRALERLLPAGWYVAPQEPITTLDSEPEPDAAVVRGEERDYPDRHPGTEDVALLMEVADSSLPYDRGHKKRIYARAGIPIYWIVNLIDRQIEVYTEPSGPADEPDYRQRRVHGPADMIAVVLDGHEVGQLTVGELLP